MSIAHQALYDEIVKLPVHKVGKALSFIRYLEQEPEVEIFIDPAEEAELQEIYSSGDFVSSRDLLVKIMALPTIG